MAEARSPPGRKRVPGESLEPTSIQERLPQLNILGGTKSPSANYSKASSSSSRKASEPKPKIIEVIEMGSDGSFELPNETSAPDETPSTGLKAADNATAEERVRPNSKADSFTPSSATTDSPRPPPAPDHRVMHKIEIIGADEDDDDDGENGGDNDDEEEEEEPPPIDDDSNEPPPMDKLLSVGSAVLNGATTGGAHAAKPPSSSHAPLAAAPPAEEGPTVMDEMLAAGKAARQVIKDKAFAEETRVKKEFGSGMKGGFFNQPAKPKKATPTETAKAGEKKSGTKSSAAAATTGKAAPIETVRPQMNAAALAKAKEQKLVLDEVQKSMAEQAGPMQAKLAQGDWLTQDLTRKFMTNPKLARGMADPRYQEAIKELQQNPGEAMKKFQHDKELTEFLTEFCTTMGEHFTHLGEKEAKEKKAAAEKAAQIEASKSKKLEKEEKDKKQQEWQAQQDSQGPLMKAAMDRAAAASKRQEDEKEKASKRSAAERQKAEAAAAQEQKQMEDILANSELRELLMSPGMQQVLQDCQEPGKLRYYMNSAEWGPKIRKLAEAGLVRVER